MATSAALVLLGSGLGLRACAAMAVEEIVPALEHNSEGFGHCLVGLFADLGEDAVQVSVVVGVAVLAKVGVGIALVALLLLLDVAA